MDRQQLEGSDAEGFQIAHRALVAERRSGAAQWLRYLLEPHGQATQMRFVDHGLGPGDLRKLIVAPIKLLGRHYTLGHAGSAVTAIERQVSPGRGHSIPIK